MVKPPLKEKRKLERIRVYYYLKVYDRNSRQDVGSVIDISMKGMKLISEIEFTPKSLHLFSIRLPNGYIYGDEFDIDAEVRWCNKQDDVRYYETGFQFVNSAKHGIMVVKNLISDFKNNNLI